MMTVAAGERSSVIVWWLGQILAGAVLLGSSEWRTGGHHRKTLLLLSAYWIVAVSPLRSGGRRRDPVQPQPQYC